MWTSDRIFAGASSSLAPACVYLEATIYCYAARRATLDPSSIKERKMIMKRLVGIGILAVLLASSASGQDSKKAATPEALKADIDGLKAAKVAWRGIAWKNCLLEGLKESRAKNKPVLLWVFIDRPADDARC
jgi:hypothetical protein